MINTIYAECNTSHTSNFVCKEDTCHDWWLLIQTHSAAYFIVNDEKIEMPADSAALFAPHTPFEYGASRNEAYSDDWLRFYTDEPFICKGLIPLGVPFRLIDSSYIHELFHLIAAENFFSNRYREMTTNSLFQILFSKLHESLADSSDDFLEMALQQLHMNIQNNPGSPWTVSAMAKQLYISSSHLHKLYQYTFGISCMDDVIKNRLRLSKELLKETHMPVNKIAIQCGYTNTEHFSRQFKKYLGISPQKYRDIR